MKSHPEPPMDRGSLEPPESAEAGSPSTDWQSVSADPDRAFAAGYSARLNLHRFDTVASTNDEAMRLLRDGARDGTAVRADRQTGGKGRMGRSWDSPPGNLYLSVIARVELPAGLAGRIAVTCGRMVAGILASMTELPVRTKWPNDLYLEGKKLGGILVETRLAPGGVVDGVVVGLGLNVGSHPDVPPPGHPATSLAAHGVATDVVEGLVEPLAAALCFACHAAEWDDWLAEIVLSNELDVLESIRVREGDEEYDAEVEGLAADGGLVIRREGALRRVTAGEVSVRPA
jgi:BirA family biotin operon repressor/biotin-[acetyl-CoA-carboxylase] ligase